MRFFFCSLLILPQVHLRKPCYDFYYLRATEFGRLPGVETEFPPTDTGPRPSLDRSPMVATGGVYKGQGRSRRWVMTSAYGEFLVGGAQWPSPGP